MVHQDELPRAISGYPDTDIMTRTVDFAIARLRKKIEADHHHPKFLPTAVRRADRICMLEDGWAKELGTYEKLLEIEGTYARLFTVQAAAYA